MSTGFPVDVFTVEGDPGAMRRAAQGYAAFAGTAASVGAGVGATRAGSWVGSEGDLFRSQGALFPPLLRTAQAAFGGVGAALSTFAGQVEAAQAEMAGVRAEAEAVWASLQAAQAAEVAAVGAVGAASAGGPAGVATATAAAGAAAARVSALQAQWDAVVARAKGIRARVEGDASACGAAIDGLPRCGGVPAPVAGGASATAAPVAVTEAAQQPAPPAEDHSFFDSVKDFASGVKDGAVGTAQSVKDAVVDEVSATGRGALATGQTVGGLFETAAGGAVWLVDRDTGARIMEAGKSNAGQGWEKFKKDGDGLTFVTWLVPYGKIGTGLKLVVKSGVGQTVTGAAARLGGRLWAPVSNYVVDRAVISKLALSDLARRAMSTKLPALQLPPAFRGLVPELVPVGGGIPQAARKSVGDKFPRLNDFVLHRNAQIPGGSAYRHPVTGKVVTREQLPRGTKAADHAIKGSSSILGNNLTRSLELKPGPEYHAHHIIPIAGKESAALRQRLLNLGLNLDDASNGVWLYRSDRPGAGHTIEMSIAHNQTYKTTYHQWLNQKFRAVRTKDDMDLVLAQVKRQLGEGGVVPWLQ